MRRLWSVALGLVTLACGRVGNAGDDARETEPGPPPGSAPEAAPPRDEGPLCNGRDEVRFLYLVAGGMVESAFLSRNGHRYLTIDGRCDYWLAEASLNGLRRGRLDPERAEVLAEELQFGLYGSVPEYRGSGCDDCAAIILMDGTGKLIEDSSGSGGVEPPVWSAAMRAGRELFETLQGEAEPSTERKTLLALRTERAEVVGTVSLDLESRSLESGDFYLSDDDPEYWVVVEDAATLAQLEALEAMALAEDPSARSLFVQDAQGRHYELLVRDEPPASVAAALDAAWSREALP